jgi:hypothetical protein
MIPVTQNILHTTADSTARHHGSMQNQPHCIVCLLQLLVLQQLLLPLQLPADAVDAHNTAAAAAAV